MDGAPEDAATCSSGTADEETGMDVDKAEEKDWLVAIFLTFRAFSSASIARSDVRFGDLKSSDTTSERLCEETEVVMEMSVAPTSAMRLPVARRDRHEKAVGFGLPSHFAMSLGILEIRFAPQN